MPPLNLTTQLWDVLQCITDRWPPRVLGLAHDLRTASDEQLLGLLQDEDPSVSGDALSAIYDRYRLDVWRFLTSRGLDEARAKDAFCETWYRATKKLPKFEWRGKPFKSWLFQTAEYVYLEILRDTEQCVSIDRCGHDLSLWYIEKAYSSSENDTPELPPSEIRQEADKLVHKALARLRPKPRQIVLLTFFRDWTTAEIGQVLHMKPNAVRTARSRALRKLEKILEDLLEEDTDG